MFICNKNTLESVIRVMSFSINSSLYPIFPWIGIVITVEVDRRREVRGQLGPYKEAGATTITGPTKLKVGITGAL